MEQNKFIECEIRGCITYSDFIEIKPLIEKDWGRFEQTPELVVFFKGGHDLRLKINKEGVILVHKKTLNKQVGSRKEIELKFKLSEINSVIEFINRFGFKKGLFSYCKRYEVRKGDYSLTIKFNTKIGDIFEIDKKISNNESSKNAYKELLNIASKYGLSVWDKETYKKIIEKSWLGAQKESIAIKGKIHNLIIDTIKEIRKVNNEHNKNKNKTISSIIKNKSNDYSNLEKIFKNKSGCKLLGWTTLPLLNYEEKVSVIIPTYNSYDTLKLTMASLNRQKLNEKQKKMIDVIVIDDGSVDNTSEILKEKYWFNLRYFKQNNLGRVHARNLGATLAKGKILIFVDSDVILEEYFLNEHIARHHYLDNVAVLGFKENISIEKNKITKKPDITKDFRFEKIVKRSWLRMHRHVRNIEIRKVKIVEETDNLKTFGKDKVLGVWDLPSMVVTNSLSIKKSSFEQIGGLNLQFKGWGMEDTFLGACLIAQGNYIIPCFSTGIYHIEHKPRSGNVKKQITEFNRNVLVYLDLVNRPLNHVLKNLPNK